VAVIGPDTFMLLPKFYCFIGRTLGKGSDISYGNAKGEKERTGEILVAFY
jgi:hypothetical protein